MVQLVMRLLHLCFVLLAPKLYFLLLLESCLHPCGKRMHEVRFILVASQFSGIGDTGEEKLSLNTKVALCIQIFLIVSIS